MLHRYRPYVVPMSLPVAVRQANDMALHKSGMRCVTSQVGPTQITLQYTDDCGGLVVGKQEIFAYAV